jgi:tetratricopeptide (TPR) repeat protein
VLDDPESVALQIYLASVTVFGQHGQSQRTEFSVPLLSLGDRIDARVAFDSWYDPSLRGNERPFFLAIIGKLETASLLSTHLDTHIFTYLDELKEKKELFIAKEVWQRITEVIKYPAPQKVKLDQSQLDTEYAIPRALQDLRTAIEAWENLRDRNQLWVAIKVAQRLEKIDDSAAGDAFILAGHIFSANSNLEDAQNAFEKASETYSRAHEFHKSGQAFCLAGRMAYLLGKNERAIELLQGGAIWIKEPRPLASLQYDLALVYRDLSRFEEANACFEKAVNIIQDLDYKTAAKYSSTYASKLLLQAEHEKKDNPNYSMGLSRRAAEQRIKAAEFLQKSDEGLDEAATSLVLAAKTYFSLGNELKGRDLVEKASVLFKRIDNFSSALKTLYDGAVIVESIENKVHLLTQANSLVPEESITPQNKHLLGLVAFELGRIYSKQNQVLEGQIHLDHALKLLEEVKAQVNEIIPVQIHRANNSFTLEDFESSAQIFYEAYELLSGLDQNESILKRKNKCLSNALISWRRGSTIYHNSGIVALKKQEERESIEYFTRSVSLLIDFIEQNTLDSQESIQKIITDRILKLQLKESLFLLAESKDKLRSIISDLQAFVNV